MKIFLGVVAGLVVVFAIGMLGLGWDKFFLPKKENIKRQVFEQTQSYVQGATQDLAMYFDQYNKATDPTDKETIRQVVVMRFSNFDAKLIDNAGLRAFLTNMRGF
jgi:hypothetical protein